MRVIHVGKYYYPQRGGMESYVKGIAENVPVEQEVIVSNTQNKREVDVINNITVTRVPRAFTIFSQSITPSLVTELRRTNADIYHLHLPNPMAAIAYLIARPSGKLVITWHSDIVKQRWFMMFYRPFQNKVLQKAHRIIATSPNYVKTSKYLKEYALKCEIIPLSVNFAQFRCTEQIRDKAFQIKNHYKSRIILFVGRLVYYKGVKYLLQAARHVNAHFLIIGTGPLKSKLERQAPENVEFLGEVPDLLPFYYACDVFVLPSIARSEAFGLVQLEAIACRRPVISTRLGTGVEFVNKHGTIVNPRDALELTSAINDLLNRDNSDMVEKNFQYAQMMFDESQVNNKILDFYSQLE